MGTNYTIQGLRGLCALVVFIGHVIGMGTLAGFFNLSDFWWKQNEVFAATGVNIFFVISGYLITHSVIRHKQVKKFMKNRVLRIYPVYLFLFFVMFTLGPVSHFDWFNGISTEAYIINFFGNLFMLHGLFPVFPQAVGNSWSLSYEFAFYISASIIFIALRSERVVKISLLAVSITASLTMVALYPRALFFLVGVALYYTQNKITENSAPTKFNQRLIQVRSIVFLVLTMVTYESSIFLSLVFSFLFFADMVKEKGSLSGMLRKPVCQYLGNISYSFYLWHPFGLFPFKVALPKVLGTGALSFVVFAVGGTVLALVLSHFSYKFIELPFTKKRKLTPATANAAAQLS